MNKQQFCGYPLIAFTWLLFPAAAAPAEVERLPDSKELMRALGDEISRSMNLQMEDLEKPYFIQYAVDDSLMYELTARYGDLTSSERRRERDFYSLVRVGTYEMDNTNFSGDGGGFFFFGGGSEGGRAKLPLEDDYTAIRQAIWWATDQDYKDAVETLTKKRAYMKDKNLQDRPHDFAKASIVEHVEPTAELAFDRAEWESRLKRISAHFAKHPAVQDSKVQLYAGAGNSYIVNTEGTRLRTADAVSLLMLNADLQAEDGMKISDSLSYYARDIQGLPSVDQVIADIDELVEQLKRMAEAPVLERYTGPVLFDGPASARMFRTLLAEAIAGRIEPVGTQRSDPTGAGALERKLEQRILPDTFRIYDDPTARRVGSTDLLGHYRYDDEGVQAERVDLVVDGKLQSMVMSRGPTKKLSGSNGHGRRAPGRGSVQAAIANLFVEATDAASNEDLKERLIELAQEEGLEFGLRVRSIRAAGLESSQSDLLSFFMRMQQRGGQQGLGDPIGVYKVYVDDGREELVRGIEFGPVKVRDLKRIEAAGGEPTVYNYVGVGMMGATPATSIIAPALLFEELELTKIEQEHEKLPILPKPLERS